MPTPEYGGAEREDAREEGGGGSRRPEHDLEPSVGALLVWGVWEDTKDMVRPIVWWFRVQCDRWRVK